MTDDEILDRLLTRFLADFAAGSEPDPASALPGRPDLAERVRGVCEMARDVSPRRRSGPRAPAFAGYEIVRELGRGGMGHVFLARHVKLGRTVALKVLPHRLATPRARERFEREARAVARLEHPLIVPVYDMGEEDGQPFFTMQFVEGRTLAAALASVRDRRPASLMGRDFAGAAGDPPEPWRGTWWHAAARAALDVADALAYAHSQGVVHRDVKPSNVMLRSDGFALLFDFGLAAVEDEATLTLTHGFVGTPHYASPEQAAGGGVAPDARTDVFSLGATLYEALTLQTPFPGPTTAEVLRRIQTWEPQPPSRLNREVPRGLETVVLAAMEKDRERRYASAASMAQDLRAALAGKTVRARRAGVLARGIRAVRRNRAITELLVEQEALRSALLRAEKNERLARASAEEARSAQARADAERDKAAQILAFLQRTLSAADPAKDGRDVRVADVLDRAAAEAETSFADRPDVRRAIARTLAETFAGLGLYARGIEIARRILDEAAPDFRPEDPEFLVIEDMLGTMLTLSGRSDEAIPVHEHAAALGPATFGEDSPTTIRLQANLGQAYSSAGRIAVAERALRDVHERSRRALGCGHVESLTIANNRGVLANLVGDLPARLTFLAEAYEGRRQALGDRHPDTIASGINYGQALKDAGRLDAARAVLDATCGAADAVLGPTHLHSLVARHNSVGVLVEAGRFAEAEAAQERIADAAARTYGYGNDHVRNVARQLARIHVLSGHWSAAENVVRGVLPASEAADGAGAYAPAILSSYLGRSVAEQGRREEAESILLGRWEVLDGRIPSAARSMLAAEIVRLYEGWGRPDDADAFRAAAAPT